MKFEVVTVAGLLLLMGSCAEPGNIPKPVLPAEGETCGTIAGLVCQDGLFCKEPTGQCGAREGTGICTTPPDACIQVYQPVCGCDGKTYGNACTAEMAEVSIDYPGECK